MPEGSKSKYSALGASDLKNYGGYIDEEFLQELKGDKGLRAYRQMADNDGTCGAIIFVISMLIRQAEWKIQAASEEQAAADAKEFLHEVLFEDMEGTWPEVLSEICTMFVYGHATMEVVYKLRGGDTKDKTRRSRYDDGLIGIRKIALRGQESLEKWNQDEDGDIVSVEQLTRTGRQVVIPMERLINFTTESTKGNPLGRSILRPAYRSWYFKKRIEDIEGVGVERDLAGYPVVYVPSRLFEAQAGTADATAMANFKALVRRIRRNESEGIVLPSDRDDSGNLMYDIKLVASAGARQMATTEIIDRYDRRIATTVLADFILLGQKSTGSFALSSDKTELFATAVGAWMASIAAKINRELIPKLWKMNGLSEEVMPTLVPGDLEKPDLEAIGSLLTSMSGAGAPVFPDTELENHLRAAASLPQLPEDQDDEGRAAMQKPKPSDEDDDDAQ